MLFKFLLESCTESVTPSILFLGQKSKMIQFRISSSDEIFEVEIIKIHSSPLCWTVMKCQHFTPPYMKLEAFLNL